MNTDLKSDCCLAPIGLMTNNESFCLCSKCNQLCNAIDGQNLYKEDELLCSSVVTATAEVSGLDFSELYVMELQNHSIYSVSVTAMAYQEKTGEGAACQTDSIVTRGDGPETVDLQELSNQRMNCPRSMDNCLCIIEPDAEAGTLRVLVCGEKDSKIKWAARIMCYKVGDTRIDGENYERRIAE